MVTTNENMVKLRVMTEKLANSENTNVSEYETVLRNLKSVIDSGKKKITESVNQKSKIKCYETMCTSITNILSNVIL